jgi:hypothetical protein
LKVGHFQVREKSEFGLESWPLSSSRKVRI